MKAEATSYQRLREHLSYLGLSTAAENLSGELDRGLKDKLSATQVLEALLEAEVVATKARRARGRLRFAHFPVHKTLALGIMVTEAGYQAYFTSAADMVSNLQAAHLAGSALYKLRTYLKPSVLVIDEVGYLPLDQSSANWIFQVVSRRYEKSAPIVLTSNRGFSDWGQVFADHVVATAFVDRLIYNAIVINIRGRSYRMRAHQDSSNGKNGR